MVTYLAIVDNLARSKVATSFENYAIPTSKFHWFLIVPFSVLPNGHVKAMYSNFLIRLGTEEVEEIQLWFGDAILSLKYGGNVKCGWLTIDINNETL